MCSSKAGHHIAIVVICKLCKQTGMQQGYTSEESSGEIQYLASVIVTETRTEDTPPPPEKKVRQGDFT